MWDLGGYSLSDYFTIINFAKPDKKASYAWLAGFHFLFITVSVATGLKLVPVIWYWSLVTSFMMFFRLRTWLEHQGSDDTHRTHLNFMERLVLSPHNAWYHYEHHAWPSVSYCNLPQLRGLIMEKPVITLAQLVRNYESMPHIPSGMALKSEPPPENAKEIKQALAA